MQAEIEAGARSQGIDPSTLPNLLGGATDPSPEEIQAAKDAGFNIGGGAPVSTGKVKPPPAGATHKVKGSDGKWHYTDGKSDLGVAE